MPDLLDRQLTALLDGTLTSVFVRSGQPPTTDVPADPLVVPGSFDPLHHGHLALARAAADAVATAGLDRRAVVFELSMRNVDKPPLTTAEARQRLGPLAAHGAVLVTSAPRFVDKAQLLPGAVFAVGHDTAVRLVDPAYYADAAERDRALLAIAGAGCRVAVAGRATAGGRYRDLAEIDVPPAGRGLFLPVTDFRVDVSSTELRDAT